jgi:acetyl esterase
VDQENTVRMDQIVEDAFGAVLWVKENIRQYKGDPNRVAVTGDSAGGHLAAMVVNSGRKLAEESFLDAAAGFRPSYMPEGKDIAELREQMEVQAAVLSYPALNIYATALGGFETSGNFMWQMAGEQARGLFGEEFNVEDHAAHYKGVSPVFNIPNSSERKLPPQLVTVGSKDDLIRPEMVKEYVSKLKELGHPVEYWEYAGRPHAFLDSGANEFLGTSFEEDAPEALDKMIDFLDGVLKQ